MTDIDDSEYIEERRGEIVAALEAEGISKQMLDEMSRGKLAVHAGVFEL